MKYLFVGDVHNHMYMFDDVKYLDDKYKFDRVIFMGDYVDDWRTTNHQSLKTLGKVLELKQSNPNKYTLLWGNHENSYVGYACSGHQYELEDLMESRLMDNLDSFDFYTVVDCDGTEYVCTHAGISNIFAREFLGDSWKDKLKELNDSKALNFNILARCSYFRGGSYAYSSFIWTDKQEHQYFNKDIPLIKHQIVGHTPVPNIQLIDDIFYIDTHSTYRDGTAFGDRTYLLWDDRGFIIEKGIDIF